MTQEHNEYTEELLSKMDELDTTRVLELIEKGADINARDWEHHTPLIEAVIFGRYEIAKLLIEKGARVKDSYVNGSALLDLAANGRGVGQMAELLIKAGADVNEETDGGYTPLLIAAGRGLTDIVKVLLEAGANVNAVGESGKTARELALERGYYETRKLIENFKG